ncbi:LacI family DNA-binding transcriptional regulator [Allosediminivita pacifica]|uniref:LacI family transcriptional regulator n=1 Tax=Allosediminivita pacifica TaxID=1267769 RepID=A0A2T6B165_9RHOB|nr:LacI family DNA-binding transcriptional regulator [Allosediminivita pacifica]PTX49800.1 LacI family transcriptional regulator [Allosediminivita pacifica]GGB04716.1 LacI family transcriptional regulator [Allosediminivita pacifica]
MRAPTLTDVARHAGVSYATADRVVNARGGVAEKSAERVRRAIAELGYVRNVAAANLSQGRTYRFAAIVPKGQDTIFSKMQGLLEREREKLALDRVELLIEQVEAFDPRQLADCLARLDRDGIDAVSLVGTNHPAVIEAMTLLRARGATIVTLVSDMPEEARDAYVGIDNAVAGRTVARLIGMAHGGQPGRVLPIVGAMTARDHAERLAGLREVLTETFPDIRLLHQIEGRDRPELVAARVGAALEAEKGITAIYSLGAGNPGLIEILRERSAPAPRPVVVVHELLEHSRAALEEGLIDVVIDQRPEDEIQRALEIMRRGADRLPPDPVAPLGAAIYVKENLPPEMGAKTGDD